VHIRVRQQLEYTLKSKTEKKERDPLVSVGITNLLTPKFGKESDLWVRFDKESVWWKEGYFQRYSAKDLRSAICSGSAKEQ
jgi:hypothetical protein